MTRTTLWRRLRLVVTILAGAFVCAWLLAAVVLVSSVGSPYPSADDLPNLPDGYELGEPDLNCASGGCWIAATVTGPPSVGSDELFEQLDSAVTDCRANGVFDRRSLCTSASVRDGTVLVSVRLRDLFK